MAIERTLSIIKPDGVAKNLIGEIYRRFEEADLQIVASRMMHLSRQQAEGFYAVHRERPFAGKSDTFSIFQRANWTLLVQFSKDVSTESCW